MSARVVATVGALILLLTVLASALRVYEVRQQAIVLEGNRLYSTESLLVSGVASTVLGAVAPASPDARVFTDLTPDGRVRAVMTAGGDRLDIPLHAGRTFSATGSAEALVGADVPVVSREGRSYVSFAGQEYEAVGYLGLRPESLLSTDVLIDDPRLFSVSQDEPLVVDGRGVREASADTLGDLETSSAPPGTSHRTNVDVVSPLLLALGGVVVITGLAGTGFVASTSVVRYARVARVLGLSRRRVYGSAVATLLLVWATCVVLTSAIWRAAAGGPLGWEPRLFPDLAVQALTLSAACAVALVAARRQAA